MKSIIRQFRFSCALDDSQAPAPLQAHDQSEEPFIRDLAGVEQQLRSGPPRRSAPPELHSAIMAKLRSVDRAQPEQHAAPLREGGGLRLVTALLQRRSALWPAPAFVALLVAALLTAVHFERNQPVRVPVIKPSRELSALPATVFSPLSTELENLNRDLKNTTDFLLASVP